MEISLKNDGHKRPLLEAQLEESFQKKKVIEKKGFYDQKYEKNWKSKNGVKTALTPLFKELWAIYVFFTNLKIWRFQKHERKPAKV